MTHDAHRRILRALRVIALMSLLTVSLPPLAQADSPADAPSPSAGTASTAGRLRITGKRQLFCPALGLYQFFGEVTVTAEHLRLQAAEMSYDAATDTVRASGHVAITPADGQTYYGETLEYRPRAGTWAFRDWTAVLPPALVGSPLTAPLYAAGETMSPGAKGALTLQGAHLTTCNLDEPHYELSAREVELYPGDKLTARDVDLYVHGRRVLHLPWLFFLLGTQQVPIMPEAGRNDLEGYFVRLPYQYLLNADNLGTLRLDLTQKRGVGLGLDHFYTLGSGRGEAFAYLSTGAEDYTLRLNHTQPLPADTTLDLQLQQRLVSNDYTDPTRTTNLLARLQRQTARTSSSLELGANSTDGFFTSAAKQLTLQHTIDTGAGSLGYSGEYRASRYGTDGTEDADLWHHLRAAHRTGLGELRLNVDQHTDLESTGYSSVQLERLPELLLLTDNDRLGLKTVPGQLTLGWGRYRERSDTDPVSRTLLGWEATPRLTPWKGSALFLSTGVRQVFYGDADRTAQYSYHADLNAQVQRGNLTATLTYGLQEVAGFSPLYMDTLTDRHAIQQTVRYQAPGLQLTLSGGRDLKWERWQDIALTAEGAPRENLQLRQTLGYDPNTGSWRDAVSQLSWQADARRAVNLRVRYDLEAGRLRDAATQLRWTFGSQWGLQWQAQHDGARFYQHEWLVTRDLHCWEAALHYDITRHAFGVSLRPKGFDTGVVPGFSFGEGRWDLNVSTSF